MITLDEIISDEVIFESLLKDHGATVRGRKPFSCIFHDDKNPSASMYLKNGVVRYKCFSCNCHEDYFGVLAKLSNTDRTFEIRKFFEPTSTKDGIVRAKPIEKPKETCKIKSFEKHLQKRMAGDFKLLPVFFSDFEYELRHSLPGSLTVLCGGPGSGKSFFVNQMCLELLLQGYKPALCALEENENFHTYRALAQMSGNSQLMNPDWVENNPNEVNRAYQENNVIVKEYINNVLTVPNRKIISFDDILLWVKNRIKKGYDYLFIDPITAVTVQERRDIADQKFINELKGIAEETGIRVMLLTHPKQQLNRVESLSNMAGGTAYERFVQNVLWISSINWNKEREIDVNGHSESHNFNRTIRKLKGRNGPLFDMALWGFHFDVNTLNFREIGLMKSLKNN